MARLGLASGVIVRVGRDRFEWPRAGEKVVLGLYCEPHAIEGVA